MVEYLHHVEKHFDTLGPYVAILFLINLILWQLRKKSPGANAWLDRTYAKLHVTPGIWAKRIIVIVLSILAAGAYLFCMYCGKI